MLSLPRRLDEMDEGSEIQSYLLDKTGQRTVPNIFISKWCFAAMQGTVLTRGHRPEARWRMRRCRRPR